MFFIFEKLTATHLSIMFSLSLINLMNKVLIFGNGQLKFEVSMYFHNKMYNLNMVKRSSFSIGKPICQCSLFYLLSHIIRSFFFFFHIILVFICIKQTPIIDNYGCITSLQRHLKQYAIEHYTYVRKIGILSWMGCSILHI